MPLKLPIVLAALLLHFVAPTHHHLKTYNRAYHKVQTEFGKRTPGRNIVKWGLASHHKATDKEVVRSTRILLRMLAPSTHSVALPELIPSSTSAPATQTYSAPAYAPTYSGGGGSGGLPTCTWQHESGGNWNAVNPSSGAYGKYQIMPSTAAGYGCNLSTHDGQTACAQTIYKNQGAGAWVGCGG